MGRSLLLNGRCNPGFIEKSSTIPFPFHMAASSDNQLETTIVDVENPPLDPTVAQQFTIQVCTSTSCTKKLNALGLDQYHVLGELYAKAQEANIESCVIIEDGGCRGGKNCKFGPCVAILHEDFDGSVALEGMGSAEFRERV